MNNKALIRKFLILRDSIKRLSSIQSILNMMIHCINFTMMKFYYECHLIMTMKEKDYITPIIEF